MSQVKSNDTTEKEFREQATRRVWNWRKREGKAGWILLWLLGVPIPVLLFLFLIRGCT